MAAIVWTRESLVRIREIRLYIANFDPRAAQRMAARLLAAGESLADFPSRGRPVGKDVRELVTVPPYILRYRVVGQEVLILGIRHGAQRADG